MEFYLLFLLKKNNIKGTLKMRLIVFYYLTKIRRDLNIFFSLNHFFVDIS